MPSLRLLLWEYLIIMRARIILIYRILCKAFLDPINKFKGLGHVFCSLIYKLILKDKSIFILKISYDKNRWMRERFFLNEVKNYISVPNVIATVESFDATPGAILMEYLDGDIVTLKNFTKKISFEMGKLLGNLHKIPVNFYGDIAKDLYKPTLLNGKLILRNYFEESFNECKETLDRILLDKITTFFYKAYDEIKNLDGPSIVHTDFKPGNVISKKNKILGLIDWENAKYSFCEEDFIRMEFLVWDSNPNFKNDFFNGYLSVRKIPDLEVIMLILKISKALRAIGFTIQRKTHKKEHKVIFDKNVIYLEKFFRSNKS